MATANSRYAAALQRFRDELNRTIETGKKIEVRRLVAGNTILKEETVTAAVLAKALAVTQETVSNWLKGHNFPDLPTMMRLCSLLGLSMDAIFDIPSVDHVEYRLHDFVWFVRNPKPEFFSDYKIEYEEILSGIAYFDKAMREETVSDFRSNRGFIIARRHDGHLAIDHVPRDHALERELLTALNKHLSANLSETDVLVAKLPAHGLPLALAIECVAFIAARHCLRFPHLPDDVVGVGIAGGYTLLRFSEMVIPSSERYARLTWGALLTERNPTASYTHHTARSIASIQQNRHPAGTGIAPLMFVDHTAQDQASIDMRKLHDAAWARVGAVFTAVTLLGSANDPDMRRQFRNWGEIEPKMFTRIRTWLQNDQRALKEACALLQGHILRTDGSQYPMPEDIAADLYGVPFDFNRNLVASGQPVWLLAAGAHKAKPALAALRGRHVNRLCIDDAAARALLAQLN